MGFAHSYVLYLIALILYTKFIIIAILLGKNNYMNQILLPEKIENLYLYDKKKLKILKLQFIVIIICLLSFLVYFIYAYFNVNKHAQFSNTILNVYEISKLYAENNSSLNPKELNINLENGETATIIGIIEINKISIKYPIFSYTSDELLKISTCKFYGPNINEPRQFLYCRS